MSWKKLGRIFYLESKKPKDLPSGMQTHAAYPTPLPLSENQYRIFFSTRDSAQRSSLSFFDLTLNGENFQCDFDPKLFLSPGKPGSFDQDGVCVTSVLPVNEQISFYYMGWKITPDGSWNNTIGLALQEKEGFELKKYSDQPILDRSKSNPFSLSYPFVIREKEKLRMWYGSHTKPNNIEHEIWEAQSLDGIHWTPCKSPSIQPSLEEIALSRPFVLVRDGRYHMWFSSKSKSGRYTIQHARSMDGQHWKRTQGTHHLPPSHNGWDSESVEYPALIQTKDHIYLLYNGNGYGKTGIGLAIWESQSSPF